MQGWRSSAVCENLGKLMSSFDASFRMSCRGLDDTCRHAGRELQWSKSRGETKSIFLKSLVGFISFHSGPKSSSKPRLTSVKSIQNSLNFSWVLPKSYNTIHQMQFYQQRLILPKFPQMSDKVRSCCVSVDFDPHVLQLLELEETKSRAKRTHTNTWLTLGQMVFSGPKDVFCAMMLSRQTTYPTTKPWGCQSLNLGWRTVGQTEWGQILSLLK